MPTYYLDTSAVIYGLDHFVSANKDLCATAEAEQLKVINPEQLPKS